MNEVNPQILKRRKATTLVKWWRELNQWQWPKPLGEPEPRSTGPGQNPRRDAWMKAIQSELGLRVILDTPRKEG